METEANRTIECDRCQEPIPAPPAWLERMKIGTLCEKCERIEAERPPKVRRCPRSSGRVF